MEDRKQCRTHGHVDRYFQSQPQSSPSFTPAKTWTFNDYKKVTRWPDRDGQQQSGFTQDLERIQESCSKGCFSSNDREAAAEALGKYQVSQYLYPSPLLFGGSKTSILRSMTGELRCHVQKASVAYGSLHRVVAL